MTKPAGISPLESAVLELLLSGDHKILVALREQLKCATVRSRERTGVGFFTNFSLPDDITIESMRTDKRLVLGDVDGVINGIDVGFLLFVKNGKLEFLEGFTYDDPWPNKDEHFEVRYVYPDRSQTEAELTYFEVAPSGSF